MFTGKRTYNEDPYFFVGAFTGHLRTAPDGASSADNQQIDAKRLTALACAKKREALLLSVVNSK